MTNSVALQLLGACIAVIIPMLFVAIMVRDYSSRRIILYFCWGVFAGLLAYVGNSFFASIPGQSGRVVTAVAPIIEEMCKALPLLLFLRHKRYPVITELIVYCAMASGVGFSIQESIYYFSISTGSVADIITLIIRTLTTALMHGMTASIFGMGLLILQEQRYIMLPITFGLLALSTSVHALFNLLLPTNLALVALLMPIGLYILGLAYLRNILEK